MGSFPAGSKVFSELKPRPFLEAQKKKLVVRANAPRREFSKIPHHDWAPPAPARECSWNPHEKAEQLVQGANAKLEHAAGDRAFYGPSSDSIHLPLKEQFPSAGHYYFDAAP
jgi:hypothetical protein